MKKVLLLCPTARELASLPDAAIEAGCEVVYDSFDNDYFDQFLGENPDLGKATLDIIALIESTVQKYQHEELAGVTSAVGYPGMSAASIVGSKLGLPGPSPESIMLCEHKFLARVQQQLAVPDATPLFHLIDPKMNTTASSVIGFPCFLKPVKSCMSKNALVVKDRAQLKSFLATSLLPNQFIDPFNDMLRTYTRFAQHATCLLQEALLKGVQVSMEGYAFEGEIFVLGVVDAVMFPGTQSFKRWQYPSKLDDSILQRMTLIARRFFSSIDYDNAMFNMELFYDAETDAITIIEVNPKIASQFPSLFQKVDGFSTYRTLLEVALGVKPVITYRAGKYKVAASCVLRTFQDQLVNGIPDKQQVDAVLDRFPDTQVQIYAKPGKKLSDEVQDAGSYRYGLIDIAAQNEVELEEKFEICKSMLKFQFEPV